MAVQNLAAKDLTLELNSKPFGCSTSASLSVDTDMDEATCQASGAWKQFVPGANQWTLDTDALWRIATGADAAANVTYKDLFALQVAGTLIPVSFGTEISGDARFEGSAYIKSIKSNRPDKGPATFSVSLQGTGELAVVANS